MAEKRKQLHEKHEIVKIYVNSYKCIFYKEIYIDFHLFRKCHKLPHLFINIVAVKLYVKF